MDRSSRRPAHTLPAVEEAYLVKFFGKDYEDYRRKVPTRILFIP